MTDDDIRSVEMPDVVKPRKGMTRALVAIAVALLLLAVFAFYLQFQPQPFDPIAWQTSHGADRARMLTSLLDQTNFVGYTRREVWFYLGRAEFDERLFWYDLGPTQGDQPLDPRGDVGDPARLFGMFRHDEDGEVVDVLYSHRRPLLGSADFDSTTWANASPDGRRTMFTSAMRTIRNRGLTRDVIVSLLGPPGGVRLRGEYDVGKGMTPYGPNRALVIQYNDEDVVDSSFIQK